MGIFVDNLKNPHSHLFGGITLSFQMVDGMIIPVGQGNSIPRRCDFEELVEYVYRFYDTYSEEEIAEIIEESRKARLKRYAAIERQAKMKSGFIYILKGGGHYKIGKATQLGRRLTQIKPKLPFETELVHSFSVNDMDGIEGDLHQRFADKRINGEWFNLDPIDIEYLMSL